jgi:hypothetical protein
MAEILTNVDVERDLTIRTVVGEVTAAELIEVIKAFYSGRTTKHVLWDFQRARFSNIKAAEIRELTDATKANEASRPQGKTAFVFSSIEGYGLGRMYQILHELEKSPVLREVFQDRQKALEWIETGPSL